MPRWLPATRRRWPSSGRSTVARPCSCSTVWTRIEGLGELLNDLVEDAEGWRLLCTATTVAGRPHEQVLRVPPLPVPSAREPLEGPAIELLLARVAAAGGHSVDLDQHDAILRGLLRASGGLPSLIEQLAVQIALVGVSDVSPADTLAEAVRRSYDLLDAGAAAVLPPAGRHRSPGGPRRPGRRVWRRAPAGSPARGRPGSAQPGRGAARTDGSTCCPRCARSDVSSPARPTTRQKALDGLLAWADRVVPTGSERGVGRRTVPQPARPRRLRGAPGLRRRGDPAAWLRHRQPGLPLALRRDAGPRGPRHDGRRARQR